MILVFVCVAGAGDNSALGGRGGATGFVQLEAASFQKLPLKEQTLAYWLSQASIAIDPINYDQNSIWGLRQKRLLEAIVTHAAAANPKITAFTKLFWANRGNHNEMTAQKFLPEFSFEELKTAATAALASGSFKSAAYDIAPIRSQAELDRELEALRPSLFDADFDPTITAKSPQGALDILQASANNFYHGGSLVDLKNFHDRHPLNSRLVKSASGRLVEEVYRAGTPDGKIPAGHYSQFLKKA